MLLKYLDPSRKRKWSPSLQIIYCNWWNCYYFYNVVGICRLKRRGSGKSTNWFRWKLTWKRCHYLVKPSKRQDLQKYPLPVIVMSNLYYIWPTTTKAFKGWYLGITWSVRCVQTAAAILQLRNMWPVCLHLVGFSFHYLHEQISPSDRLRGVVTLLGDKRYKNQINFGAEIWGLVNWVWDHQMDYVLLSSHLPSHNFVNARYDSPTSSVYAKGLSKFSKDHKFIYHLFL